MDKKRKYEKPVLRSHGQLNTFIHGNSPTATGYDTFNYRGFAPDGTTQVFDCVGMGNATIPGIICF